MRRIYKYKIRLESMDEMLQAGRFNRCLMITFKDRAGQHCHKLSAGRDDVFDVYREGTETYILSINPRLGYINLEVFDADEKIGAIHLKGYQVNEIFGSGQLAPFTIIKRLRELV